MVPLSARRGPVTLPWFGMTAGAAEVLAVVRVEDGPGVSMMGGRAISLASTLLRLPMTLEVFTGEC